MKERCIATMYFPNDPETKKMYDLALLGFEHYARRVNADLHVIRELNYSRVQNVPDLWYEKCNVLDLLKEYKVVLWIDLDILIKPDAEDIFDYFVEGSFSAFPEDEGPWKFETNKYPDRIGAENLSIEMNAGVMLQGPNMIPVYKEMLAQYQKSDFVLNDQVQINLTVIKRGILTHHLPKKFNYMCYWSLVDNEIDPKIFEKRLSPEAQFIHYAGGSYLKESKHLSREKQFAADYKFFY